jgi:hypothetical protein
MRYTAVAAGLLAGGFCCADVSHAQEACVYAPNGAIVCGPIVQPNFGQPNYGQPNNGPPPQPHSAPGRNFEERRDYDERERRDDRRGARPDARPDMRHSAPPPDMRRGEPPPEMRRGERPQERRPERPEQRQSVWPDVRQGERPDAGQDRDRRGSGPNPCARFGSNFTLQDGECRPYVRR